MTLAEHVPSPTPERVCIGVSYHHGCRCERHRTEWSEWARKRRRQRRASLQLVDGRMVAPLPTGVSEQEDKAAEQAAVLDKVISGELSSAEAAKTIGCHRNSINAMKKRYKSGGVEALLPRGPRHGTNNAYERHGCRCELCRAAYSRRCRRLHSTWRKEGKKPARHGLGGYSGGYRCRCDVCVAADRANNRRIQKNLQAASLETAIRHRYEWTGPDLEILARTDMSNLEKAKALGRTYSAVLNMLHKLKEQPREQWLAGRRGRLHG